MGRAFSEREMRAKLQLLRNLEIATFRSDLVAGM
jgi:hypothetical protein